MKELAERVISGEERAIARAISFVENNEKEAGSLMRLLYPHTGKARVLGITGPPGAGKSTLTDGLVAEFSSLGKRVGVIAVDPTSPFSGGAVLGDRIRMRKIATLPGVFVRSMATRGAMGGLAPACMDAVDILDSAGMDLILIETVGVGQDEIEIIRVSELNLVVLVPGLGDEIQAIKSGIMEIADIFVINKADQDGVEKLESQLNYLNQLSSKHIPIIRTVAVSNSGIKKLQSEILSVVGSAWKTGADESEKLERAEYRLKNVLLTRLLPLSLQAVGTLEYHNLLHALADREIDPYTASDRILAAFTGNKNEKSYR